MAEEWNSRLYTVRGEIIGRIDALEERLDKRMTDGFKALGDKIDGEKTTS